MNMEDVIKTCGPLPQVTQNIPNGNKKYRVVLIAAALGVFAIVGHMYYRQQKRKKDLDKK
jgi:hypothetical protein